MNKIKTLLLICLAFSFLTGCFEDLDDNAIASTDIKDFIWKAMNAYYLYNGNVTNLSNDRFGINGINDRYDKTEEYQTYLDGFDTPEALFETLVYEPLDEFSAIVPNYLDILNAQQGTILSNGLEFRLYFVPGSDTEVYGAITLVLNNSVAEDLGLVRGQIFRAVDGTNLNENNFRTLLNQTSYTLNFADYNTNGTPESTDDSVTLNGESTSLTKVAYTENPVHIAEVLEVSGTKIAYLMYNGFTSTFDSELNNAFAQFQSQGAEELVLDLRYNGGGSIQTAVHLASMITGQYNGQVFSKLFYNNNQQSQNRDYEFTSTLSNNSAINSLNLNRVYVLTSSSSASASELVINSLNPYSIDVVHIGDNTRGKTQSNRLVFDSPDFGGNNVNAGHNYALIPLTANSTNVNDELVPSDGLTPDLELLESPFNLGVLGSESEPLLAAALQEITTGDRSLNRFLENENNRELKTQIPFSPLEGLMLEE
ncbi:S41 family peptidase [Winogradskyella sp.]|jgi:C-terminal processing protease CtpA/Prc|uniref:S41 family peptidase n=1 Tax=Winogradskyella sp. TaxID=1883156 RepID=UPI0025E4EEF1|nr:S41 family peptidase [Winogradskyella sp.]MCT4630735.1 S41 family peptidase [Winogradskyella sp.]